MKKYIAICFLSTLLVACSSKDNIKSQLEVATDSFLDVHNIQYCPYSFNKKLANSDEKIGFGYDFDFPPSNSAESYDKTKDLLGTLTALVNEKILTLDTNQKLYFSPDAKKFLKLVPGYKYYEFTELLKRDSRYTAVDLCFGKYHTKEVFDLPDYSKNDPTQVTAKFKVKLEFYPWVKEPLLIETPDPSNYIVFSAIYKKSESGWNLDKITNIDFVNLDQFREKIKKPAQSVLETMKKNPYFKDDKNILTLDHVQGNWVKNLKTKVKKDFNTMPLEEQQIEIVKRQESYDACRREVRSRNGDPYKECTL